MINDKKILCVITARKGSKGITGKNYNDLFGKPLFMWSVLAAMNSKYVDRVVVSSNCDNVYSHLDKFAKRELDLCRCNRVTPSSKMPFFIKRPEEISGDLSKNEEALIHSIQYLKDKDNEEFDIVINLQPTSPCRLDFLLDRCIIKYNEGSYDSLLTAIKITPFLWQKINGKWEYNVDKNGCCNRKMRQEFLEDDENSEFLMHDNGNIFISNVKMLLETKCRVGSNPCVFETDKLNSLQIDEEFDFELIENMAKVRNLKSLI